MTPSQQRKLKREERERSRYERALERERERASRYPFGVAPTKPRPKRNTAYARDPALDSLVQAIRRRGGLSPDGWVANQLKALHQGERLPRGLIGREGREALSDRALAIMAFDDGYIQESGADAPEILDAIEEDIRRGGLYSPARHYSINGGSDHGCK